MNPPPTGRVETRPDGGHDLVVSRRFAASAAHLWADVTEPDLTARWFGTWKGVPGEGRTVHLRSTFEDGAPWSDVLIRTCRPPHALGVTVLDAAGRWELDVELTESGAETVLSLTQRSVDPAAVGDIGPGWEYYLDMLVASRKGEPLPTFGDYYPAQSDYFVAQVSKA